jgi:hypothetical protein
MANHDYLRKEVAAFLRAVSNHPGDIHERLSAVPGAVTYMDKSAPHAAAINEEVEKFKKIREQYFAEKAQGNLNDKLARDVVDAAWTVDHRLKEFSAGSAAPSDTILS